MTDWFRSWHGAPTDPKWLGIARKANVAPGIAVAVAWALMDRASQAAERGSIEGYDADGLAYFFGCEPEQVVAIVEAMTEKGVIENGHFHNWEKRQPKREDGASERAKEWRERNRTQPNAGERKRTLDTDTDTDNKISLDAERDFEAWYEVFPRKVGKGAARKAYRVARKKTSAEALLAGATLARQQFGRIDPQFVPHPASWLNGERWLDEAKPDARVPRPKTARDAWARN